jgi:hypothetical protein
LRGSSQHFDVSLRKASKTVDAFFVAVASATYVAGLQKPCKLRASSQLFPLR